MNTSRRLKIEYIEITSQINSKDKRSKYLYNS